MERKIMGRIYTEAQLKEIEERGVICPECGKKNRTEEEGYKVRMHHCFSCNFWLDRLEDFNKRDDVYRFIIDKHCYSTSKIENHRKGDKFSGFAGRRFLIKINETQEVIDTCNLWHQGEVPIHFLDRLPDNATFENETHWVKVGDTWCLASEVVK